MRFSKSKKYKLREGKCGKRRWHLRKRERKKEKKQWLRQKQERMRRKRERKLREKKRSPKNLSYAQLRKRGIKITPTGDYDRDRVPNALDCRPLDHRHQDMIQTQWGAVNPGQMTESFIQNLERDDLPERERIKLRVLQRKNTSRHRR